ncbi:MAG: ATP-binding protein [Actinomycetota bacterium]
MATVLLRNPRREVEIDAPKRVKVVLRELDIDPETVLVIRGEDLLTREDVIQADDQIEVRPVISGGAENITKCRRCRGRAVVELRRHNAAFCKECFLHFFRGQVERAIEKEDMLARTDRVVVAVSGGKDSLALWDVLIDLGYDTTGYHIVLWTGEDYATESLRYSQNFADSRGVKLIVSDLREEFGFSIPDLPSSTGRTTCGACGLVKRHLVSKSAHDLGFDVIAIGHNLDDEAAVLFGNVLRWDTEYMARQSPVLPETDEGFVKKVKPLFRLSEKETASYAFLRGIDYQVEECPLVAGNTQLRYKNVLDVLERDSPGAKAAFYHGFLERGKPEVAQVDRPELNPCSGCGMPTPSEVCAYCRMLDRHRRKSR